MNRLELAHPTAPEGLCDAEQPHDRHADNTTSTGTLRRMISLVSGHATGRCAATTVPQPRQAPDRR